MNRRKLQKNRRRLLAKPFLTPEEERWVIDATQRLSKASGVIPLGELPPEEQLREARRIIEESALERNLRQAPESFKRGREQ